MGAEHPYGPARYTNWRQCYDALLALGLDKNDADILAAIGGPESGYDLAIVNNTPATGDYSVGVWQINYYGSLRAGRVAAYGTPKHLAQSTVSTQAKAALNIYESQGFDAWHTTYSSGAYKAYLHGTPAGPPAQHQLQLPPAPTNLGADDFRKPVVTTAGHFTGLAHAADNAAKTLRILGRRG